MKIRDVGLFILGTLLMPAPLARLSGLAVPVPGELLIVCDVGIIAACIGAIVCSFQDPQ